jgi:YaiO family outer membrane protein
VSARAWLLAGLALWAGAAHAQEIEAGFSRETLTGGRPDWESRYLEGAYRFGERQTLYGQLRETERFGLRDTEVMAGLYLPLSRSWTALVEASGSETHRVLPHSSIYGELHLEFLRGWGAKAGLRRSKFTNAEVDVRVLGFERYFGAWRAAYTLYSGRPEQAADWEEAHQLRLDRYYGERSSIGLAFTSGREAENVGPPLGIVVSDVESVSLIGRHWLGNSWAVSYELLAHEQGDLYRRRGLRIGARYGF